MGYNILFEYNDDISVQGGFVYKSINGHSATNSSISSISDNIGNFDDISLVGLVFLKFGHKFVSVQIRFPKSVVRR